MSENPITGHSLVAGSAHGKLLVTDVGLSFWGGVDPASGMVIDQHHPLCGECVSGCILAMPCGRGSSTGSSVLLELILNGLAPAALVFSEFEEILTLGVVVAEEMFEQSLPVLQITTEDIQDLNTGDIAIIDNGKLVLLNKPTDDDCKSAVKPSKAHSKVPSHAQTIKQISAALKLSSLDTEMLNGCHGKAAQVAMRIVLRMTTIADADELIDVTQGHIDACVYNGPSSLRFARQFADWEGRVRIPTTLNSISVDKQRWQKQGIEPSFGEPASALGDAFAEMGARESYTCAPYLLDSAPTKGQQIVWAESNAVVYANSVIGARTLKYPDFLDVCIALTGRAPKTGSHLDMGRIATISVMVDTVLTTSLDDAFWPLLGYHIGRIVEHHIPIIDGLNNTSPSGDDLKAFSAAFATTSSAPMFHMTGVTPEAAITDPLAQNSDLHATAVNVNANTLFDSFKELNTATDSSLELVCLGNPHFSLTETARLASLCQARTKNPEVDMLVTMGRTIYNLAANEGHISSLEKFGVQFITDTCWCMLTEPVIRPAVRTLMTNSGKYAHYAPGMVNRKVHFASLAACVEAACQGFHDQASPVWLAASVDT